MFNKKRSTKLQRSGSRSNTAYRNARPASREAADVENLDSLDLKFPKQALSKDLIKSAPQKVSDKQTVQSEKLHKVLADAGVGSRREMEELIIAGRVSVNSEPAYIGQRVTPKDLIKVNGRPIRRKPAEEDSVPRILIYHKPAGEIVSRDDPQNRRTVFDHLPSIRSGRWIAVGRLDFNTEGLLIFTNDGALANYLMHPRHEIEREYAVRVQGTLTEEKKSALLNGVHLEDGLAKFTSIVEAGGKGFNRWYVVKLSEGRNREVRRMFEKVELPVSRLIRVNYGDLNLPQNLTRGKFQELPAETASAWLNLIGFDKSKTAKQEPRTGAAKPRAKSKRAAIDPLRTSSSYPLKAKRAPRRSAR